MAYKTKCTRSLAGGLASLLSLWMPLALAQEPPPPPAKIALSSRIIDDVLSEISAHLKDQGAQEITALVLADEQDRLFVFQREGEPVEEYQIDASLVVVPVNADGKGAVTTLFREYAFIHTMSPAEVGSCGENHGGRRNCN